MAIYPMAWVVQCDRCGKQVRGAEGMDVQAVILAISQVGWRMTEAEAGLTSEMHCAECVGVVEAAIADHRRLTLSEHVSADDALPPQIQFDDNILPPIDPQPAPPEDADLIP